MLWQTLLAVLGAVLTSHPHLGTQSLWQLQAEPLQVPGQDGTVPAALALPWCSPASSHCSEAFGYSWFSPTCYSCHSFCMVRPQQSQQNRSIPSTKLLELLDFIQKAPKMALFSIESSKNGFTAYEKLLKLRYFKERAPKIALFHKSGS